VRLQEHRRRRPFGNEKLLARSDLEIGPRSMGVWNLLGVWNLSETLGVWNAMAGIAGLAERLRFGPFNESRRRG
jgi:hypothetical protein